MAPSVRPAATCVAVIVLLVAACSSGHNPSAAGSRDGGTADDLSAVSQPAERVRFVHGAIGTTVTGSVRSGDTDTYILSGLADVTLTVDLSSVPDTAVFDVHQPNGLPLARDATSFQVRPPQDVEYHVVVRPNSQAASTTYDLKILTGP